MALLELSDGLSNEACVSLGNKLVCSKRLCRPVVPPAVRSLQTRCVQKGGGGSVCGSGETKYTRLAGKRSRKKKSGGRRRRGQDESYHLLCQSIYISFSADESFLRAK